MTAHRITLESLDIVVILLGENGELVILDHGIGKKIVSNLVELLFISAIDIDFDRFSDANRANPFKAEMLHGEAGGDSGGIKNGGFRHDGDNSFHEENENRAESPSRQAKRGKIGKIINLRGLRDRDGLGTNKRHKKSHQSKKIHQKPKNGDRMNRLSIKKKNYSRKQ